eukprot:Skav202043  [mRNA]  locus=scaffold1138:335420:347103:- [translate_table: standard]
MVHASGIHLRAWTVEPLQVGIKNLWILNGFGSRWLKHFDPEHSFCTCQAMRSSLALCPFLVAVGIATDLCCDAPCVENSVLLQYKRAANISAPCMADWPGVDCQGVFHIDAGGHVTGPVDSTPLKAKKSQAKSSPKSMILPGPGQVCTCDSDQAFIMSAFPTDFANYEGLKTELEKYFSVVTLLVDQFQADFQLSDKFPLDTPGPCLYFVWFNEFALPPDRNFLQTRASEGATVLTNANFFNLGVDLYEFFFPPGSATGLVPQDSPCATPVQMQPSPNPGDIIAQALTAGVPFLPRGLIAPMTGLVLPGFAQVVWRDPVGGDTTILRELGQGLVIWDGTFFVESDQCGVPLPPEVQTYVQNLVHVTFSRACTTTTTSSSTSSSSWRRHVHSKRQVLNPEDELELVAQQQIWQAARCHNCLVTRWLPANERYHILQASVNAMRKLQPPTWGFFNSRHAEAWRIARGGEVATAITHKLIRTPADSNSMSSRSPFTSERTHAHKSASRTAR